MSTAAAPAPRVVTLGESMGLLASAREGSLLHDRTFELSFGGAESNVAIGLSRLGTAATWISRLGDDRIGQLITRELRAEGVEVIAPVDAGWSTGLMMKERRPGGRSEVFYYRRGSAASALSPGDVDPEVIRGAALLHLTGITPALSGDAERAVFAAVEIATESNVPISFDLNHRSRLWSAAQAVDVYARIIPRSTVVFAGADEARLLFPGIADPASLARHLSDLGAPDVVIKLGADGCVAVSQGAAVSATAVPVAAIDTVGAGDAFTAGYLHEWLRGSSLEVRLERGVVCGAFACLSSGDWEGSPTADEAVRFGEGDAVRR